MPVLVEGWGYVYAIEMSSIVLSAIHHICGLLLLGFVHWLDHLSFKLLYRKEEDKTLREFLLLGFLGLLKVNAYHIEGHLKFLLLVWNRNIISRICDLD